MQVVNFNNMQDDIVYHSNIFNYDKKFLNTLIQNNIKINFKDYAQDNNVKQEDIAKVIEFLNKKSKEQVDQMTIAVENEYGRLPEDDQEIQKKVKQSKQALKALRHMFSLFKYSFDKAEEKVKNLEGDAKIEPGETNADNVIACLLFFDGISMVNIDVIKLIENNASYTTKNLTELVFMIINNNYVDFHIKEIASHILSISFMQYEGGNDVNENENFFENCKNLMKWSYEISIQKNRDSCLTSNLSLLLTLDENIEYFLGKEFNQDYNHLRKIFDLMTDADININIIYESLLCLWSISSNKKFFYIFENKNNKYIEKIVQVIRTNKIDKVARIGLMTLQNLLESQTCVEILFDIKFMQTVSILLTNKWNDPIIRELLNLCFEFLEKNYKSMK